MRVWAPFLVVCLLAVGGCSQGDDRPSAKHAPLSTAASDESATPSPTSELAELGTDPDDLPSEPKWTPITNATPIDATPAPLTGSPSPDKTKELASSGRTRIAAETFALSFAQLQFDVDVERDPTETIGELVSDEMDPELRNFLIADYAVQRALGGRSYVPGTRAWMRSAVDGNPTAPSRVNTELAGVLGADATQWGGVARVDVVWEEDRWKVLDYALAVLTIASNPEQDLEETWLNGPGWRQLPTA